MLFSDEITVRYDAARSRRGTRRHRCIFLLVSYTGARVMIDCGLDGWKLERVIQAQLCSLMQHPISRREIEAVRLSGVCAERRRRQSELSSIPIKIFRQSSSTVERTPPRLCGITIEAFGLTFHSRLLTYTRQGDRVQSPRVDAIQ